MPRSADRTEPYQQILDLAAMVGRNIPAYMPKVSVTIKEVI
jgi:hypothetical protein